MFHDGLNRFQSWQNHADVKSYCAGMVRLNLKDCSLKGQCVVLGEDTQNFIIHNINEAEVNRVKLYEIVL